MQKGWRTQISRRRERDWIRRKGPTISETYHWKGVNTDDGLNYYVLADTHNTRKTPLAAASYWGEALDFLVSVGDNVSWTDREADLTEFLYLASDITKGEIPTSPKTVIIIAMKIPTFFPLFFFITSSIRKLNTFF